MHDVDAKARDAALLGFLRQPGAQRLPLWAELQEAAFVPNGAGSLCVAAELCDPTNPKLLCLMDRTSRFPAAAYAGDFQVIY